MLHTSAWTILKQVAQWARIAHLGASFMFVDIIIAGNSEFETVFRKKNQTLKILCQFWLSESIKRLRKLCFSDAQ